MCLTTFNETLKKETCRLPPTQCGSHLGKQYLIVSQKTALKTKILKFEENACSSLWYAFICTRIMLKEINSLFQRDLSRLHFDLHTPPITVLHLHWTSVGHDWLAVKRSRSHFIHPAYHPLFPSVSAQPSDYDHCHQARESQVSKNDYMYTIVSLHSSQYTAGDYI